MLGAIFQITEKAKRRAWLFAFLFALFFAGGLSVWSVYRMDGLLRADLLRRTWYTANALNVSRLYSLTGSKSDLEHPDYVRLKKQMAEVMQIHPDFEHAFLLCRQSSGQYCQVIESCPVAARCIPSVPGRAVTEGALQRVLSDQRIYLEGFVTRYKPGRVTAFVPVNDPKTGKMIAVLGMEVCNGQWRAYLLHASSPAILLGVLLIGLLLLAKRLVGWRKRRDSQAYAWITYIEPGIVFVIGLLLTAFMVWSVVERGREDQAEQFRRLSSKWTAKIAEKITTLRDFELEGVAKFFECSGYVSDGEFADYSKHLQQDIAVEQWSWVVSVSGGDRQRFERETVEMKGEDFVIWEPNASGERMPALERDLYYPIYQLAPLNGNSFYLGYDFGSDPACRRVLEETAQSRLTTATDMMVLGPAGQKTKGFYVFRPVFTKGAADKVLGYVAALVRLESILAPAEPGVEVLVSISLVDGKGPSQTCAQMQKATRHVCLSWTHIRPLFAFGKTFVISARATDRYLSMFPLYAGWWTALVGFLLTAGVCILQLLVMKSRCELQILVDERTYRLRKSEEHLEATLRSIADGVIVCDVGGQVTSLNGVAERLTGWSAAEAVGRDVREVFRMIDAKKGCPIPNLVNYVLKEGRGVQVEGDALLMSRTLCECPISSSCALVRDDAGTVIGAVLVFRDETSRKREERIVRASAERMEATLELARMSSASLREIAAAALERSLILTHSKIGYIAFLNEAQDEVTLYSWSKAVMDVCQTTDKPLTYSVADMGLWGESIRQRKTIITNNYAAPNPLKRGLPAGHVHLIRHVSVPIFFDGKIVMLIGAGNKGTDYTEDDVTQLSLFMHGLWNIIKRKHTEEALKAAKDEAERAMRIKSEFLANMSHEIRTPLNAVIGMSDLLSRTQLSEPQQKYLQRMNSSSRLLLQIINDILDFSKMEAGRLKLDVHPFLLHHLIDSLKDMFGMVAAKKGLELLFHISPEVPRMLVADHLRLSQILTNLLSNAIKFTARGKVELTIFLLRGPTPEASGYRLRFEVRDTGIGLNEEHVKNLFHAFTQADASTTRKYGGTGLGLVISRRLVELMGGRICVDSVRDQGSVFYFDLELEAHAEVLLASPEEETSLLPASQGYPDFRNYTVLVVEDNLVNQEVVVGLLEVTGISLVVAENGRVALQKLGAQAFDLILMDLQMPEMDGFETIQRIRDSGNLIPIIALSAAVLDSDRAKATKAGANDFIIKPIEFPSLLLAMKRLLGNGLPEVKVDESDTHPSPIMQWSLPGFDVKKGLEQVNGMQELYLQVLASFLAELEGAFADLPDRLLQEMTEATRRKVHTLKGLAGTVGALRLARVAAVVNTSLTCKQALSADIIENLREAMHEARESLETLSRLGGSQDS